VGFRFQKRFSILPGVRVNLSKGGLSTSLGPRGADVNIGKNGVTTSAGIPGTDVSYRQNLGGRGSRLGILTVLAGLGLWGFTHFARIEKMFAPAAPKSVAAAAPQAAPLPTSRTAPTGYGGAAAIKSPAYIDRPRQPKLDSAPIPGPRYVHREGSVLRDAAKTSGRSLKKESKGAKLTLEVLQDDGWAKVTDGSIHGWMRASVLGVNPPE
jgi:uncharacterized protein YgiM (DUF1202 family)